MIMDALEEKEDRQTFLFSATMASDYDKYVSKKKLYFNENAEPVECGLKLST